MIKLIPSRPLYRWLAFLLTGGVIIAAILAGENLTHSPLYIGFLGDLSGNFSDLGQQALDGSRLAVEECNASGGIDDREVRMLVRDDGSNPQQAIAALQSLADRQALAIVGPVTSDIAVAVLPFANHHGLVLLSPTVSGDIFATSGEYLFRIYPAATETAQQLARYALQRRGLRRIFVLYESSNLTQFQTSLTAFTNDYLTLGGKISGQLRINDHNPETYLELARKALAAETDGVLILADSATTAILCQQLHKLDPHIPICTTETSMTTLTLNTGGKAVEGLFAFNTVNPNSFSDRYQTFCRVFYRRFGYAPDYAAVHGYDATRILLLALSQGTRRESIKTSLTALRSFESVQGRIRFNEWGDVRRELSLVAIREGKFATIQ